MTNPDSQFDDLYVASLVKSLMESKGIDQEDFASTVADALGMSKSNAYRKLRDPKAKWLHTDILQIEGHLGVRRRLVDDQVQEDGRSGHVAKLRIGGQELDCRVWLGLQGKGDRIKGYAAFQEEDAWFVVEASLAPDDQRLHAVERVELTVPTARIFNIAVLDDSRMAADSLCDALSLMGFDSAPFYSLSSFSDGLSARRYDGYILDWILQDGTSESVVKTIREMQGGQVPIVLLTGQIDTGLASESDIARAIVEYGVISREKPVRSHIIGADLMKALSTPGMG